MMPSASAVGTMSHQMYVTATSAPRATGLAQVVHPRVRATHPGRCLVQHSTAPAGARRVPSTTALGVPAAKLISSRTLRRVPAGRGTQVCAAASASASGPPAIVWFKHDLRLDDHPGLAAAIAAGGPVTPLFVFSPELVAPLVATPRGAARLLAALAALRESLRALGSDLVVRVGAATDVIPALAAQVGASTIHTEEEVEAAARSALQSVAEVEDCELASWRAPLWTASESVDNWRSHVSDRGDPVPPLSPPEAMPPVPEGIDVGELPSVSDICALVGAPEGSMDESSWEVEEEDLADALCTEASAREAYAGYLRYLEGNNNRLWDRVNDAIRSLEIPGGEGGSFPQIFNGALQLGLISRRRIHAEALKYERDRNGGMMPLFPTDTSTAATSTVERGDFHINLALQSMDVEQPSGSYLKHWRWRGGLTDYVVQQGAQGSSEKPAILLVHGFGAFGEHWRGNIPGLAAAGYDVYAPTFPGFGRSEKLPGQYSQILWTDFLRDFTEQVVGRPVVVVGNSIGGFISACLAGDHSSLVAGLVLINSAGKISEDFSMAKYEEEVARKKPPPKLVADLGSRALFAFLEGSIAKTLTRLYPTNPDNADEWLAEEIFRAACDDGAIGVFRSAFYLPPPRPLNFLVDKFAGPTMVLQGALDPLNDAKGRAEDIGLLCPSAKIQLIDAGHCPHDEVPEMVNGHLLEFIDERVLPQVPTGSLAAPAQS